MQRRKAKKYTDKQKLAYYKKKALAAERRSRYARGHGAYSLPKNFFSAPKTGQWLGSSAGALLGNYLAPGIGSELGSELGGYAGKGLGQLFKSITGWGDYEVKQNSLLFPNNEVPSFGEDSIRVRKREFVCSIESLATDFNLLSFPINPGLDQSFPWLSAIARNYEQYRFNGLIYQFVSTSSDAIASTTSLGMGQVILATDYSAVDDDFQSGPQMLGSMFSTSGKPSENIMHAIECAPDDTPQKLYYVRTGSATSGTDKRLWDLGKFQIATDNMPAAYKGMGQLWVSYDVTFCKAVQNNTLGLALNSDVWHELGSYTPTNANPFGTALSTTYLEGDAGSNLGCSLSNTAIYFPDNLQEGYFAIQMMWVGTAAAVTAPTFTYHGCGQVNAWFSDARGTITGPQNGGTSTNLIVHLVVKLGTEDFDSGTNYAWINLSAATLPTSVTKAAVCINQINGDIFDGYATSS